MNKRILALTAALAMAVCSAGCSGGSGSSSGTSSADSKASVSSAEDPTETPAGRKMYSSQECFDKDFANAGDLESGPLLTISNTTAKPGGIAEVTLSVRNAEKKVVNVRTAHRLSRPA